MPTPNDAARQAKGMTREEFHDRSDALARCIATAVQQHITARGGEDAFVILQALASVHRHAVGQLPPDAISAAAFAMATYAGVLTQLSITKANTGGSAAVH